MPEPVFPADAAVTPDEPRAEEEADGAATMQERLAALERECEALRGTVDRARERERMLAHELQHRVRNMLAVIRAIFRRTQESGASPEEFAQHFQGRLDAVTRYQSDLVGFRADGIELEDIVRDQLLDVQCTDGPKISISGPPLLLRGRLVELVGLAIHELTTNSIKFGALYHQGDLRIEWSLAGSAAARILQFQWSESSVPLLAPAPRPRGFGRQFIEEGLPYQTGATTAFEFRPGGLDCAIALPLPPQDFAEPMPGTVADEPLLLPPDPE